MAETRTDSTPLPKRRARLRFNPLYWLVNTAIEWIRRYLQKNLGVDLDTPDEQFPRAQPKQS
jgi:hypothetical protein